MTTTKQHGGRALERQVMNLWREGWHIPNIASIARVKPDVVKDVLERNKVILDGNMK